jgi:RNA polymerase sigma-70 factor (ECF subfamily)
MPTDEELIRRCAQGNAEAVRELIRRFDAPLRRFLSRLVDRPDDVDDALAEVFVRLWRTAPRFRGECSGSRWIYRIAVTSATDLLRKRRRTERGQVPLEATLATAGPQSEEPDRALMSAEWEARCRSLTRSAIASLKPDRRVLVTLHYLEGFTYRELAAVTGLPVTTVRMRLFAARRQMERHIRARLDDDEVLELEDHRKPRAEMLACGENGC